MSVPSSPPNKAITDIAAHIKALSEKATLSPDDKKLLMQEINNLKGNADVPQQLKDQLMALAASFDTTSSTTTPSFKQIINTINSAATTVKSDTIAALKAQLEDQALKQNPDKNTVIDLMNRLSVQLKSQVDQIKGIAPPPNTPTEQIVAWGQLQDMKVSSLQATQERIQQFAAKLESSGTQPIDAESSKEITSILGELDASM